MKTSAAPFVPPTSSLPELSEAVDACRGCPLWEQATQGVFGEGPADARLVLVGEQPGNDEDLSGRPFVGPAGHLLDRALADAGIDRAGVYVTNAVKHFKWTPRGKVRLHQSPSRTETVACKPWLDAELDAIKPALVVALGAVAAKSLLGPAFSVTRERGVVIERFGIPRTIATFHPSAVLRAPDDTREETYQLLVTDLRTAAQDGA